jgi:hypothetical protein
MAISSRVILVVWAGAIVLAAARLPSLQTVERAKMPPVVRADDPPVQAVLQIAGNDLQQLRDSLIALAENRLRPLGLSIDRTRTTLSVPVSLPALGTFRIRPMWLANEYPPALPLRFELLSLAGAGAPPVQVTLAVALQRAVP